MSTENKIEQELNENGALPANIDGTCFDMPENYFANFEEKLKNKIQEEIFLQNLPKQTPYHLPENYLENFKVKINENEIQQKNVSPKMGIAWRKIMVAAASIVLLLSGTYFYINNTNKNTEYASIDFQKLDTNFTTQEANAYVLDNIDEFEIEQNEIISTEEQTKQEINTMPKSDIQEYLDEATDETM
jgi:hypothetical protein